MSARNWLVSKDYWERIAVGHPQSRECVGKSESMKQEEEKERGPKSAKALSSCLNGPHLGTRH
jgi:hypothetical protein